MAMFLLTDATGIGSDDLDSSQGFIDLTIIVNDDGFGLDPEANGMQLVTYAKSVAGIPQDRMDNLVNTTFSPDYGGGAQQVDIIVIAGLKGFVLDDGTSEADNGTALPPKSSGLAGAGLNSTENCLVIYDTQQTICVARDGTGGDLDLPISNPVVVYHELSHALRILQNGQLALTLECDPSSPEEHAAIVDENDMRTQLANRQGNTPELRDPNNHCGKVDDDCSSCCIIASLASRSPWSPQVQSLRAVRDYFVRGTEVGHDFFDRFFYDYYAFSPQVCTIMASNPGMGNEVLNGFVEPLLTFWKMLIERSQRVHSTAELAELFLRHHPDRSQAERRLRALEVMADRWLTSADSGIPSELLELLRQHAWPSEYMQWALIAPVRIYSDLLARFVAGEDAVSLGSEFQRQLDAWSPEIPISGAWGVLSSRRCAKELRFCYRALLQTNSSRDRFFERLGERFAGVTAVIRAIGSFARPQECFT